jgi:hypothetical protein
VAFTITGKPDSNTPDRTTTYFPSSKVQSVTSSLDSDTYLYDADGREQKDTKADGAYFTNDFYPDGKRAALSTAVASDMFQYEYKSDGSLFHQEFSMPNAGHSGSIVYGLSPAGRVTSRTDTADGQGAMVTTYQRDASAAAGQVTEADYPGGNVHSGLEYDADGELLGESVTAQTSPGDAPYTYQQTWRYNPRGEVIS